MNGRNKIQQTLFPILYVFVAAALSFTGYFGSGHVGSATLHQLMAVVFGTTYFLSIAFGALYIFTTLYVRGTSLPWRILASLVVPFIWMTKEVLRLTESHPLAECLYWYFNPLNVWLVSLMVLEMGIATVIARSILKRRRREIKIVTPAPIAVILGSLVFVISAYAWGKGENIYVIFLEGYRLIFGSGT
jgi:hypothetical protein